MAFEETIKQVKLARSAFEGDAGAMQPMRPVEDVSTQEAIRKLQVQILHLGNAIAHLVDDLESRHR